LHGTNEKVGGLGEMNVKINIFEKDLESAEKWEHPLAEKLKKMILLIKAKKIEYHDNPTMQKNGIDILFQISNNDYVDVKVRLKKNHWTYNQDILFEEETSMPHKTADGLGEDGWFYKCRNKIKEQTDQLALPHILYTWENTTGDNLEPIGYLIRITKSLCRWYEERSHTFKVVRAESYSIKSNTTWWTRNRSVSLNQIPSCYIDRINPKLAIDYFTEQSKLNLW
jgi:hypothetical protein